MYTNTIPSFVRLEQSSPRLEATDNDELRFGLGEIGHEYYKAVFLSYARTVRRSLTFTVRPSRYAMSQVFRRIGGPNNPDFTAFGRSFDITTETRKQVFSHMKRSGYGEDLIVVTYHRPPSFRTFPSRP